MDGGLDERRSEHGPRGRARRGVAAGAQHDALDEAGGALAVGGDGAGEVGRHGQEAGAQVVPRGRPPANRRADPVAWTRKVSLVLWSPSTVMAWKLWSQTATVSSWRSAGSIRASVDRKASMVAMPGAIIPEPLAIPPTVIPPIRTACCLGCRSVVRMARARASGAAVPPAAARRIPGSRRSMGSGTPMTPVSRPAPRRRRTPAHPRPPAPWRRCRPRRRLAGGGVGVPGVDHHGLRGAGQACASSGTRLRRPCSSSSPPLRPRGQEDGHVVALHPVAFDVRGSNPRAGAGCGEPAARERGRGGGAGTSMGLTPPPGPPAPARGSAGAAGTGRASGSPGSSTTPWC